MRNAVPPQSEVQGQPLAYAPVVLHIGRRRDVIPLSADLNPVLCVLLGKAHEIVAKIVSAGKRFGPYAACRASERTVEFKVSFSVGEGVLDLFVDRPAETKLKLMRTLRP